MSARMKEHPTKGHLVYKVMIEAPGKKKRLSFVSAQHIDRLEAFLEKYSQSDAVPWEELAKERIAKYTKAGLALRGARYREGLSQKELAKRSGIAQENISKMENGKRFIGEKTAKKLAKVLGIDFALLMCVA